MSRNKRQKIMTKYNVVLTIQLWSSNQASVRAGKVLTLYFIAFLRSPWTNTDRCTDTCTHAHTHDPPLGNRDVYRGYGKLDRCPDHHLKVRG